MVRKQGGSIGANATIVCGNVVAGIPARVVGEMDEKGRQIQ